MPMEPLKCSHKTINNLSGMEMSTQTKSKLSKVIYLVAATFLAFRAEAQTATPPAEHNAILQNLFKTHCRRG